MSIKDKYTVRSIKKEQTYEWILKKHYAHRLPSLSFCFGLFCKHGMAGVMSFGMPPNYIEMKAWEPFDLLELNRLIVNDGLEKNSLSFFLSSAIKLLPNPKVLISYSDFRQGHHGYIYQATNWIYTGVGGEGQKIYIMKDGSERHQRHEKTIDMKLVESIERTTGKARYFYFHGDKRQKRKMVDMLRFTTCQYPKGDNKRYNTSYKPSIQMELI